MRGGRRRSPLATRIPMKDAMLGLVHALRCIWEFYPHSSQTGYGNIGNHHQKRMSVVATADLDTFLKKPRSRQHSTFIAMIQIYLKAILVSARSSGCHYFFFSNQSGVKSASDPVTPRKFLTLEWSINIMHRTVRFLNPSQQPVWSAERFETRLLCSLCNPLASNTSSPVHFICNISSHAEQIPFPFSHVLGVLHNFCIKLYHCVVEGFRIFGPSVFSLFGGFLYVHKAEQNHQRVRQMHQRYLGGRILGMLQWRELRNSVPSSWWNHSVHHPRLGW